MCSGHLLLDSLGISKIIFNISFKLLKNKLIRPITIFLRNIIFNQVWHINRRHYLVEEVIWVEVWIPVFPTELLNGGHVERGDDVIMSSTESTDDDRL